MLAGAQGAGERVAIIGAGGIGFDVAEFLTSPPQELVAQPSHFQAEWGIDAEHRRPRRACRAEARAAAPSRRQSHAAAQAGPHGARARPQHRLGAAPAARQAQGGADERASATQGSTTPGSTSWSMAARA